jgi:uncharacterized protein
MFGPLSIRNPVARPWFDGPLRSARTQGEIMSNQGRFVWRELVVKNQTKASAFYENVFGWRTSTVDMGGGYRYTVLKNGEKDVGSLVAPPADGDVPPNWLTYITVDDIDAVVARVPSLGGSVVMGPYDAPNIGRIAIVADPQGAKFAAFQSLTPGATDTTPATHSFCWSQIVAKNVDALVPFYTSLFGWTPSPMGEGQVLFTRGEEQVGSAMQMAAGADKPTHWLNYVAVSSLAASTKKAQAAGAELLYGPIAVPSMGSFAVLADPTGAHIALWEGGPA